MKMHERSPVSNITALQCILQKRSASCSNAKAKYYLPRAVTALTSCRGLLHRPIDVQICKQS